MDVKLGATGKPVVRLTKRHRETFDRMRDLIAEAGQITAFKAISDDTAETLNRLWDELTGATEPVPE